MPWRGIKHKTVKGISKQSEWESEEGQHELAKGTVFPAKGNNDGDLFWKTDEKRLYIYVSDN